ncbi:DNA-binding LacI/PurR family transcriptional regulator [Rhodopirellula rubra]|uniref:DNA-binding LacI/PurR family transcriptional regulator n=1 Tax=Aporhodopirellula rubra TaxID=980271 RepID=A0A7W5H6J0_9BACT|nr:LacI family DNA-binding transcriptional regulator [Aporhodopirellula rubra]MBB3206901.1 DNA-binding LacI/PurR family transcriptional regulator [Aporhodopirellula rubra]
MAKTVNQQLIADRLQISRATVSRCFTNHPGINPETRGKVFRLAAALGYTHMETRTGKGRQRSAESRFGILICTDVDDYLNTDYQSPGENLIAGVSDYAQLNDVTLEIHYTDPCHSSLTDSSYAKVDALSQRSWDGALLVYPFPKTIVDELNLLIPVVSLVEQYSGTPVNCVDVDHHRGISAIIGHLSQHAHQRIGFLTHDYGVDAHWALRRHSAYVEEMTRLGLVIDPANVLNVRPSERYSVADTYARALERTRYGVTAWVCAADHQAYGLISYFNEHGIKTPADVSVTGFDGIEPPDGSPQLTTVSIPYYEIGQIGCRRLQDLASKRFGSAQHTMLDCALREGTTVGPVV